MNHKYWLVLLFCANISNAQTKFNNEWVCGVVNAQIISLNNGALEFNRLHDTTNNINFWFDIGASNICDSFGHLVLASNGYNITNNGKTIVDGADSIGGREFMKKNDGFSGYSQNSIFIPFSNSIYYFVNGSLTDSLWDYVYNTSGADAVFDELMFTKIDMKGNGGAGKLLQREVKLLKDETLSKTQMMACKHANGRDWWLLKQARGQNKMFKFLFTQDSVYNMGTQSFIEPIFSKFDQGGQLMFSQDGSKIASTCRGTGQIFVGDFNRCNGVISNPKVYTIPSAKTHNPNDTTETETFTEGLAFSPNGRFLFVNMYFNIQQLDFLDNDTITQWSIVAGLDTTWDEFQQYSCMYLGPDNKLYVGNWNAGQKQMSYFNTPNNKGLGSSFCPRCLRLPRFNATAPPCMPNYDLGVDSSMCWPLDNYELPITNEELVVYPNPATDILTIRHSFEKGEIIKVDIYDNLSRKVKTISCNRSSTENSINVENLTTGLYYYIISLDNTEVKKGKLNILK